MYCPKCGNRNEERAKFCTRCGTRLLRVADEELEAARGAAEPVEPTGETETAGDLAASDDTDSMAAAGAGMAETAGSDDADEIDDAAIGGDDPFVGDIVSEHMSVAELVGDVPAGRDEAFDNTEDVTEYLGNSDGAPDTDGETEYLSDDDDSIERIDDADVEVIPSEDADSKKGNPRRKVRGPRRRSRRWVVILIALVVLLAGGAFAGVYLLYRPAVDLNPYLTVSFEGYDSLGKSTTSFDADTFMEENAGTLRFDRLALWWLERDEDADGALAAFLDDVDANAVTLAQGDTGVMQQVLGTVLWENGSLAQTDHYSNGDTAAWSWTIDADVAEAIGVLFHCTVVYEDTTYTVSGLTAVGTYDPFQNVTVTFEGAAPDGKAVVTVGDGEREGTIQYTFDKESGLSNGDEVTLTAAPTNGDESDIEQFGSTLDPRTQTYTVADLTEYIQSPDDITDEELEGLRNDVVAALKESLASNSYTLTDSYSAGEVWITANDGVDIDSKYNGVERAVLFIYHVNFTAYGRSYVRYTYVPVTNVRREPDGVKVDYMPETFLCKLGDTYIMDCFYDEPDTIRWDLEDNRFGSDYTMIDNMGS